VVEADPHEPALRARLLDHAGEFIRRGLLPVPGSAGAGEAR
jgi:hypothetical protein